MFGVPHKVLKTAEVRIPMPGTEEQEVPKLEDVLFELFDEDRQYMYIGSENLENPHPQPQLQSEPQSEPQPQFQPQSQPKPQFQLSLNFSLNFSFSLSLSSLTLIFLRYLIKIICHLVKY